VAHQNREASERNLLPGSGREATPSTQLDSAAIRRSLGLNGSLKALLDA
jgi:hypothetical protein